MRLFCNISNGDCGLTNFLHRLHSCLFVLDFNFLACAETYLREIFSQNSHVSRDGAGMAVAGDPRGNHYRFRWSQKEVQQMGFVVYIVVAEVPVSVIVYLV
jgi:hypothetical protein